MSGIFMTDHKLQNAAGHMEDSAWLATPEHLNLHSRPDTHRQKSALQDRVGREGFDPDPRTFPGCIEWHVLMLLDLIQRIAKMAEMNTRLHQ